MEEKKQPSYDLKSRRQLWQMYQHNLKVLTWATHARKQAEQIAQTERTALYLMCDELVTQAFTVQTRLKRISKKLYDVDISALEVYK